MGRGTQTARTGPWPGALDRHAVLRLGEAVDDLDAVERRARPVELALATHRVARCYVDLDMPDTAEWYFQQALRWARTLSSCATAVEILCELADALARQARLDDDGAHRHRCLDRARDCAFEATALASRSGDRRCEGSTLLAVSEVLAACGDHGDAATLRQRARALLHDEADIGA
jgi:hypothetical protein